MWDEGQIWALLLRWHLPFSWNRVYYGPGAHQHRPGELTSKPHGSSCIHLGFWGYKCVLLCLTFSHWFEASPRSSCPSTCKTRTSWGISPVFWLSSTDQARPIPRAADWIETMQHAQPQPELGIRITSVSLEISLGLSFLSCIMEVITCPFLGVVTRIKWANYHFAICKAKALLLPYCYVSKAQGLLEKTHGFHAR